MKQHRSINGTSFVISGEDNLPALILIHGLGLSKDMWKEFIPILLKSYKVITFDLFGHGNSDPLNATPDLVLFANQILELLHYLNIEKAHLIGFSIGGMINRKFAVNYPSKVLSLIILNSPHKRDTELQKTVEERAKLVFSQGALATLDDALKRWFTSEFRLVRTDVITFVRQWRKKVDEKSYAQIAEVLATGVKELINQEFNDRTPTLVMTCENDSGSTPSMAVEIAKDYLYSDLVILPDLKHLGVLEAPVSFTNPILRFLERIE